MALAAGDRLGPYEISGPLGSGGMGDVYRARDPRLGRDVAIKVLPREVAGDSDRLRRFEQEARALAALNHPNILAVHDVGVAEGVPYLVTELLDGDTLRSTLGSLPFRRAIDFAVSIATGLAAAHARGLVHRDLKPENIIVTREGHLKLIDFGLATLHREAGGDRSSDAALTQRGTEPGTVLGTVGYMAPEQVRGQTVDYRADIFAFGAVLYEMLTGRRAFDGATPADTMSAILHTEISVPATATSGAPPMVEQIILRCLEKDPVARFQSTADLVFALRAVSGSSASAQATAHDAASGSTRGLWWLWPAVTGASLLVAVAVVLGRWDGAPSTPPLPEMRLEIDAPATTDPVSLALSPDGQTLAFVATSEGQSRLWLRPLNAASARPLPNTDGASRPFWSPDSRSVAYFADGQLKQAGLDGGSPRILANTGGVGGTWSREGIILFSNLGGPIFRIPERGGDPTPATRLGEGQASHGAPQFLPDGRHFLYWALGGREGSGVYVGQLDGPETRRLLDTDFPAVYAPQDRLLFVRQGTLFAQPFDGARLALVGTPFPLADQVTTSFIGARAAISTSAAGPVAYRTGSAGGAERQLTWFDRSGHESVAVAPPFHANQLNPSLSPDGRRVALFRSVNGNIDIWLLDVERGVPTRLTFDAADDVRPVWSRDGSRIAFNSNRKGGTHDLYLTSASGAASETVLLQNAQPKSATDWSPDGRFILYDSQDPLKNIDMWAVPLDGDRKPFPVVQTDFEEHGGQFSPDGKWVAYVSIKSGRYEVYVRPFAQSAGNEVRVSTEGGDQVRWRPDGKELFYIARDGQLVAVPIRFGANGETVEAAAPVRLFATHMGNWAPGIPGPQYAVSPDGQRFLLNTLTGEVVASPITLIVNWTGKP